MKFKGKVAVWWYLIIVILNAALIGLILKYGLHYIAYFYILPVGLLDLYLIPVCFANYVEIYKKKLFIRFGFQKKKSSWKTSQRCTERTGLPCPSVRRQM